jgi:ABC-type Mn2+/Zn2+ transport system ATPase subunit
VVVSEATFRHEGNLPEPAPAAPTVAEPAPALVPAAASFELRQVSFVAESATLIGIAGAVGAGKTTLLEALLGEVPCTQGGCFVQRTTGIAFAGQTPWIFAGSLRENVVFDTPYDPERYGTVLEACALLPDIAQLPDGDLTELGEKGINLSGGQKARVALARACYSQAEVVLLDDPLSAVDHKVAEWLFAKAIRTVLARRTVLLVTHHPHFVARCDRALLVERNAVREVPPASFAASPVATPADPTPFPAAFALSSVDLGAESKESHPTSVPAPALAESRKPRPSEPTKLVMAEDRQLGQVLPSTYTVCLPSPNPIPTPAVGFGCLLPWEYALLCEVLMACSAGGCRPMHVLAGPTWRWQSSSVFSSPSAA